MVHFHNAAVAAAAVTSVVLSSLAPGVQAAPAMPPLPMRQEARRSMLNSGDIDLEKRDLKIKGCFDPDHSLHYNYHHGCASEDGHGHGWHGAKERRTIDLEAIIQLNAKSQPSDHHDKRSLLGLNLGGNNGILGTNKDKKGILGGNGLGLNLKEKRGDHVHIHAKGMSDRELKRVIKKLGDNSHVHIHTKEKRSVEAEDEESDDELEKRSPEPRSRHRNGRYRHRHHDHDHDHDHVHIHSHKRDEIEARDPRHHHHSDRDHDHDHVHVHSHKRDEIEVEESDELEKRSKSQPKRMERKAKKSKGKKSSSKSAKSFSKKTDSKGSDSKKGNSSKKSKSTSSKKNKNAATSSGKNKDAGSKPAVGAKVSLGKRALEQAGVPGFVEVATPLFNSSLARTVAGLVFTANPDPSPNATTFVLGTSDAESTQFYLTTASNPDPSTPVELNVVNIRVPILDSQTLKVVDYCATFDLTPPSPLSLLPCGKKDGFSQNFAYNGTTGEIQPLYSTTPAPMALVSNKASQQNSSAQSFAATGNNSTAQAEEEDPEDISLYFIPASTYYEAPNDVNHLIDSHKNRTLAASMSSSDDGMGMTSTSSDAEPTQTDLPTSTTDSSSAPDATMTSAPTDGSSSSDDYSMDSTSMSMDASSMDSSSMDGMTQDSMNPMPTPTTDSMMTDDPMATPTDSAYSDDTLSTSTLEPTPSSTPLVNQNNAATPSSSSSASSSMMASSSPMPSASASSSSSAPLSSMTPSGTPSASIVSSSSSTSTSASAAPTVTIQQSTDYSTPGFNSDPNAGIDPNSSNYSPMARRRFARW